MKYFRQEEEPRARFPKNFIGGFLEVGTDVDKVAWSRLIQRRGGIDPAASKINLVHSSLIRRLRSDRSKQGSKTVSSATPCYSLFSSNSSLAVVNFSETTSQASMRSSRPFSSASCADVPEFSARSGQHDL